MKQERSAIRNIFCVVSVISLFTANEKIKITKLTSSKCVNSINFTRGSMTGSYLIPVMDPQKIENATLAVKRKHSTLSIKVLILFLRRLESRVALRILHDYYNIGSSVCTL